MQIILCRIDFAAGFCQIHSHHQNVITTIEKTHERNMLFTIPI
jgi:hypothetical protein